MGRYEAWETCIPANLYTGYSEKEKEPAWGIGRFWDGKRGFATFICDGRGNGRAFVLYDCRGGIHRGGGWVLLLLLAASAMKSKEGYSDRSAFLAC